MSEILPLDKLIETTTSMQEDENYRLSKAKSPRIKRAAASALKFWNSINHHLQTYQALLKDSTIS